MGLLRLQRHISLQRSRVGLFLYQTSALSIRLVTLEQFKGSVMNLSDIPQSYRSCRSLLGFEC
jgi:hypothetical protein